jgi:hypothetical protein
MWPSRYTYDIFLSYAVEDRAVVNAIRDGLLKRGLKVWYVREDMPYTEDLKIAIAAAMNKSRFIVAIVSWDYLMSDWGRWEYGVFVDRDARGQRAILQVLHNIAIEDLVGTFIETDRWSMIYEDNASDIPERIYLEVRRRPKDFKGWVDENIYALKFWFVVALFTGIAAFTIFDYCRQRPWGQVEYLLESYLREVQQRMTQEKELLMASSQLGNASIDEIQEVYNRFNALSSRYSNSYELLGDGDKVTSRRGVMQVLQDDPGTWTPSNKYDLFAPIVYLSPAPVVSPNTTVTYMLSNTATLHYEIVDGKLTGEGRYEIRVKFEENIRFIVVRLTFPSSLNGMKNYYVRIRGFEPYQRYVFTQRGSDWILSRDND